MNIYQKKIVKESELFFLDDLVQQGKNNNKNQKTNICKEFQPNLNIRKFYGLSSKLLKKDSEKNNRQLRSKSQIFSSFPLIENIIPKEIKTIIIKLHNQKEQKESEESNKNNFKTFSDNKFQEEKNNKNIINIKNNNYNTNIISVFVPQPEKKQTRNKSVINNKNENNIINISLNTIYKKSYCIDKQNKFKGNKERSTTAPKNKLNINEEQNNKINNKLGKNISSPNIHNTIDLNKIPKIKGINKIKSNKYINTNIFQNININNNINNLNVLKYDLSILPDKNNNSKLSEILTSRNNNNRIENSKIKIFGSLDGSFNSNIKRNIHNLNIKNNYQISKFNELNNRYTNNNRNHFWKNKMKYIYTNKNGNKYTKNNLGNKNKENNFKESNKIKEENNECDINIKNIDMNNSNKISKIKSIPLKLSGSSLFLSIPSK